MASWLSRTAQFWNEWGLRIAVLSSFTAHVALVLLARTRRQNVSLWGTLFLWLAYQLADIAATYALGNLSLGGITTSSCEQQLAAFWAPLLLLHLGRPDNISAYALEDNTFSLRQSVEVALQVLGASYVLYQYIYLGDSGDLLPASLIMFAVGVAKYVERAFALRRGDLGNIRGSSKQQQRSSERLVSLKVGRELDNEEALRFAHNLFHFCQRAMVDDSSVKAEDKNSPATSERIFSLGWRSMSKVVEMELSLMYDILYTKATVIHTWGGYLIRLLSPLATATAASLFWFFPKDCLMAPDIIITYILLAAAFLLDVVWLVRALGSTWAYAFLNARPGIWLHHALLCSGWWRWLRGITVSLDPSHWLLGQDPRRYRLWSGNIGRYNLLDECTRSPGCTAALRSWLLTKVGLEDSRRLFQLPRDVKELMFVTIKERLEMSYSASQDNNDYTMKDITIQWGQKAVERAGQIFEPDRRPFFGHEFQEDILVWHIGTCIFLACTDQQPFNGTYAKAIEALSEYLMFLVAVRRHMLPGLVLRSLFEVTRQALGKVREKSSSSRVTKEKLAKFLRKERSKDKRFGREDVNGALIWDGAALAIVLLEVETDMLKLIFDVWVDKLLYAGTRCSRESHAKQLGCGGELTTIVWIMTEHAGPFRIGQLAHPKEVRKKEEEKKPEEKKPDDKKEKMPAEPPAAVWIPEQMLEPPPPPPPPPPKKPEAKRKKTPIEFATLYPPY